VVETKMILKREKIVKLKLQLKLNNKSIFCRFDCSMNWFVLGLVCVRSCFEFVPA